MPASYKCLDCARWSFAEGCDLEHKHYYQFRDCVTEQQNHKIAKITADQPENDTEIIRCKRCGAEIQGGTFGTLGEFSAKLTATVTGGLCKACYDAAGASGKNQR